MKNSFIEDLNKSFLYKVIGLVITLGLKIFITRTLGISSFGVWKTALSWMEIIIIISLGGNTPALLRSASHNSSNAFDKLINIGIQVFITYLILYGAYWIVAGISGYISSVKLHISIIIAFFYGIMKMFNGIETSMMQAAQKNYLCIINNQIIRSIINAISIIFLFLVFENNILILSSYPIAECISIIILLYLIINNYDYIKWSWKFDINFNIHFWINDIVKKVLPFINIAILSFLITDSDIGGYSISYSIGHLLMIITTVFVSFSPVIVRYFKEDRREKLETAYLSINKILLVVVYPFFLSMLVYSNVLLSVFGQGFADYSLVLQILIVGVYMDAVTGPIGNMLAMTEYENIEKNINIFAAVLNIILLFLLTIFYGIVGAAVAYALPRAFANIAKLIFVYRELKIRTVSLNHVKIMSLQIIGIIPFLFISEVGYRTILFITVLLIFGITTIGLHWLKFDEYEYLKKI